jgi:serine O-acetyltransferase
MISSRKELDEYLIADRLLYPHCCKKGKWKNFLLANPISAQRKIYSYIVNLRYAEWHQNNSKDNSSLVAAYHKFGMLYRFWRLRKLAYQTGIQIPPNTFGKGLQIWHWGSIIVNDNAKIGDYATIYPGVVIGAKSGEVPTIGSNVFIGAGAKILGGLKIGDNVIVAPNAVVVTDVPDNAVVGGIPAKILKFKVVTK